MKERMTWLKTGIAPIDLGNERTLKLIKFIRNASHEQCENVVSKDFLETTLNIMRQHFDQEEQLMIALEYRKADEQIAEHLNIMDKIKSAVDGYTDFIDKKSIMGALCTLIEDHMMRCDIPLAALIKIKMRVA